MSLSDAQIERYCRQIVLPEVGSRGQERLLQATVSVFGADDSTLVCATYLAAAGVGRLALSTRDRRPTSLPERPSTLGLASVLGALRDRNPDCRILEELPEAPDVEIWIGPLVSASAAAQDAVTLWGSADEKRLTVVHFERGRACFVCLHDAEGTRSESMAESGWSRVLLGSLLTQEALDAILGLGEEGSQILRGDLERSSFTRLPFPRRPHCPTCGRA